MKATYKIIVTIWYKGGNDQHYYLLDFRTKKKALEYAEKVDLLDEFDDPNVEAIQVNVETWFGDYYDDTQYVWSLEREEYGNEKD